MKYPSHIILDVNKNFIKFSTQNWISFYLLKINKQSNNNFNYSFIINKNLNSKIFFPNNKSPFKHKIKKLKLKFFFHWSPVSFFKSNSLWTLFDINFIKKEFMYTKLKYSRVPQYDIVSGGVAALFAGFIGFLVSEKFGLELADSGDFYYLFMYLVFIFFGCKLYFKIISLDSTFWNILSLNWLIFFLITIFNLLLKFMKNNKIWKFK